MTKQTAQNLNLIGDSVILLAASAAPPSAGQPWHWLVFLAMSAGSIFVWMLGGRILRHYDSWNGRGIGGRRGADGYCCSPRCSCVMGMLAVLRPVVRAGQPARSLRPRGVALHPLAALDHELAPSPRDRRSGRSSSSASVRSGVTPASRSATATTTGACSVICASHDEPIHDRLPAEMLGDRRPTSKRS